MSDPFLPEEDSQPPDAQPLGVSHLCLHGDGLSALPPGPGDRLGGSTDQRMRSREEMVGRQLIARGIRDEKVLQAISEVPREAFLAPGQAADAYLDRPLPIGDGQTISQPYVVALMAEALELEPDDRVLDIGTGSGYGAAILGKLAGRVITLERIERLAQRSAAVLTDLGFDNVEVHHADGSLGWLPDSPYDAIVAGAAASEIPAPWLEQLAVGGRLVAPVGRRGQVLIRIRRVTSDDFETENLARVRFVPLLPGSEASAPPPGTRESPG